MILLLQKTGFDSGCQEKIFKDEKFGRPRFLDGQPALVFLKIIHLRILFTLIQINDVPEFLEPTLIKDF